MEENQNTNSEAENSEGVNYEELVKTDKNLQSFLDSRITNATKTAIEKAKTQWQLEIDTEKSEAEKLAQMNEKQKQDYEMKKIEREKNEAIAELNSYKLKEQAIKIAGEKGLDISLLEYLDYRNLKAEEIGEKIDSISTAFKNAVEKAVNERLKEPTPISQNTKPDSQIKAIPTII